MSGALSIRSQVGRLPAHHRPAWLVAVIAAVVTVALNIAYPLAAADGRDLLSVVTVLVFATASVSGAWARGGPRTAILVLLVGGGVGLVAEIVGVATGLPFGSYRYGTSLGPRALGVPWVVPLAWVMMTWPAWVVGTTVSARVRPARRRMTAWLAGAWSMAAWDLFLDPQMVAAGHWTWDTGSGLAAPLPGIAAVPVSNLLGWSAVSLVVIGALMVAGVPGVDPARVPGPAATLFTWTWAGGIVANLFFFGRPGVAVVAGVLMGVVAVPFGLAWLGSRRTGSSFRRTGSGSRRTVSGHR